MCIAKQVNPAYQEIAIEWDTMEHITITGNKDYNEHTCIEYDQVYNFFESGYYAYNDIESYSELREVLDDELHRKIPYTEDELATITTLINEYYNYSGIKDRCICDLLSIYTGNKWLSSCIHGYNQGEWQKVFYDSSVWSKEGIDCLEIEYFNKGSEWFIDDDYYMYCYGSDYDEIRKEIAAYTGEEEITLMAFCGYDYIPKYEKV